MAHIILSIKMLPEGNQAMKDVQLEFSPRKSHQLPLGLILENFRAFPMLLVMRSPVFGDPEWQLSIQPQCPVKPTGLNNIVWLLALGRSSLTSLLIRSRSSKSCISNWCHRD